MSGQGDNAFLDDVKKQDFKKTLKKTQTKEKNVLPSKEG
jgi:hypothetical protein